MQYINLSAYKFVKLEDKGRLKKELQSYCESLNLKGTILLAEEGINLSLSGSQESIEAFKKRFEDDQLFHSLPYKESPSETVPFKHMRVKVKKEIIAFGVEGLDPLNKPAPYIKPQELKQWYDEGKDFAILDTRNDYEVVVGTFKNAIIPGIHNFRDFPEFLNKLEELKDKPIVTFCTGGVRCEKAASLMVDAGFKNVYQLDGGILKYFEECGASHYEGECFVFDERVSVNEKLAPTGAILCNQCQMPLTTEQQTPDLYNSETGCIYCKPKENA